MSCEMLINRSRSFSEILLSRLSSQENCGPFPANVHWHWSSENTWPACSQAASRHPHPTAHSLSASQGPEHLVGSNEGEPQTSLVSACLCLPCRLQGGFYPPFLLQSPSIPRALQPLLLPYLRAAFLDHVHTYLRIHWGPLF